MRIGNFSIWISPKDAAQMGATNYARMHGIIPGFFGADDGVWISRSDMLNPIEDALSWLWVNMRLLRGEEPDFMFEVGGYIE